MLRDPTAFAVAVDGLAAAFLSSGIDHVLGIEARGFIFAAPVAYRLGAGFVPVRKAGKLPWEIEREEYALEYGTDVLEMHRDAIHAGDRMLVVDDVLATGGTASATGAAGRAARWRGGGLRLPGRARIPRGPGPARGLRGRIAARLRLTRA